MRIKWYGHAAFRITSDQGTRIILDPYESGGYNGQVGYGKIEDAADLVLISHGHGDHNFTRDIPQPYELLSGSLSRTVKGIPIKGIATFHDSMGGAKAGANTIFTMEVDGLRVCHGGDLGHVLAEKELAEIGPVDILLLPVGGYYTIDAETATRVAEQIAPRVLIPMHYKTEKCGFPIAPVEEFLSGKKNVRRTEGSEVVYRRESLPEGREIVVLRPAL